MAATTKTVDLITGARPNFMKVAPLFHQLSQHPDWQPRLIHTGQHYDHALWAGFLRDFGLPDPDINLDALAQHPHADRERQLQLIEQSYGELLDSGGCDRPALTVVVGDVNSTLACARAASERGIPLGHLEAGLRSHDWDMPEEHNRVATDEISDRLWTPSRDGNENLRAEGISEDRIRFVGNIMIDAYCLVEPRIQDAAAKLEVGQDYAIVTIHRPENVDHKEQLTRWVRAIVSISQRLMLAFPVHPRTEKALRAADLWNELETANIKLLSPMGYIDFMAWVSGSRLVLTDSGGIQEETTWLKIPCLTLRKNTERPVTIDQGTNQLITVDDIESTIPPILEGTMNRSSIPEYWDGNTARRVVDDIQSWLA